MTVTRPPTRLESALRSGWMGTTVLIVGVLAASWVWIVAMARDMYGPMTGASRWMMTARWGVEHTVLLWAMWAVMMTAMMLPSATPLIMLFGAALRRRQAPGAASRLQALVAGYLSVWALFSVGATVLQRLLAGWLLSPMMEITSAATGAGLLVVAGAYQFTPLKAACLEACQSPLGFLMSHWREGWAGAWRMGAAHGLYCLGCCWALMLLLFAGGVMNLTVIAALTVFVALEKTGVLGRYGVRVSGAALMAAGVWMLAGS